MAYVDLNPVRTGVSDSLDSSDFTSIQERLISHAKKVKNRSYRQQRLLNRRSARHLIGRQTSVKKYGSALQEFSSSILPLTQKNYLQLLETTTKVLGLTPKKRARPIHLLEKKQSALKNIGISSEAWLNSVTTFNKHYSIAAGTEDSLVLFHNSRIEAGASFKHPHKWIRGVHAARLLYGS